MQNISRTTIRTMIMVACTAVAIGRAPAQAAGRPVNLCQLGVRDSARACQGSARSDRWIALARCANIGDSTERRTCDKAASTEQDDALETCADQTKARQALCQRLGGAPYEPVIDPTKFVTTIDNPFFPLVPGTTFVYEGQTAGGLEHVEFAVTHNTRVILGVACVEVHDTVRVDGILTEDTLDWFTQDTDGNVWYFGEGTFELENGVVTSIDGAWTGGVDGARPGIIMKAHPVVGDFYRQESLAGEAEDLAEVVSLNEQVTVPAGSYTNVLKTKETTPLEPEDAENKFYAPGVGNISTVDLVTGARSELVRITIE